MTEQMQNRRVVVCGFEQESNSFNPVLTEYEDFAGSGVYEGESLVSAGGRAGEAVSGMLEILAGRGYAPAGGVAMRAKSGGPVRHSVVERFLSRTLAAVRQARPAGVLLSLHGATLSDSSDDVCGDILTAVRKEAGAAAVISASCDLHANVTEAMLRNADFICGYRTYPHLDQLEVGRRAARLLTERLDGRPLVTCASALPVMAPPHAYTTSSGGLKKLMDLGCAMVKRGDIADFSVFQVQPWLDVPEIGSAVVVVADREEKAKNAVSVLSNGEFALRHELQGAPLWNIEAVLSEALSGKKCPVVLIDEADSPNAGSCGDCADVLRYLLPHRDRLSAAVAVNDKNAVRRAFELGVGKRGDFVLGAGLAPKLSEPVTVRDALVKSLHDGQFLLEGPAERGQLRHIGSCAVLTAGKIQILVAECMQNNGDLQFYRGFGIEPTLCELVAVKACTSLRAGYEPISAMLCNTDTPGAANPSIKKLPFRHLPRPFFPFREIGEDNIPAPRRYR